jgi:SOS-response transcriptional repressor LexA/transcriptional regulator with XRE-family HTH domain
MPGGMSIRENLKSRIALKGFTVKELAELSGVNKRTIDKWVGAAETEPRVRDFYAVCGALGVSMESVVDGKDGAGGLTDGERGLLETYNKLTAQGRLAAMGAVKGLLADFSKSARKPFVYDGESAASPVFSLVAEPEDGGEEAVDENAGFFDSELVFVDFYGKTAAGKPIDALTDSAKILLPKRVLQGDVDEHFCLEISGGSMTEAGINDGDIVLLRRAREPANGKIMLVRHENSTTLKRVRIKDGAAYLCWEDGSGRRIKVDSQDYEVQGILIRICKMPQ